MKIVPTLALATAVGAAVFLTSSRFFSAWDGHAISQQPRVGEAGTVSVLIAEGDDAFVVGWPAAVTGPLDLPVDPRALGPAPGQVATGHHTVKERFSLSFRVDGVDAPVSTASAGTISLGVLVAALIVAARNMAVGGSPWSFAARALPPLRPLPPAGSPARTQSRPGFSRPERSRSRRQRR